MATPDYLNYVLNNPGLREEAEAHGYTQAEMIAMGEWHWENHGQREFAEGGRLNTPFETQIPTERTAQPNINDIANMQASVRRGDPSEMWASRAAIDPAWNVGQFSGEGWNFDPDNPYREGILGDTIEVNRDIGQLVPMAAGDQRFLQDRYVDASIANDFPVGWTTPENTWAGPEQLGNFWDVLTNATRDDAGILGRVDPYDPTTAVGPSVSPGTRGGGNIRSPATGGPPNPTVPSFGYPQYQDWTRFMPTNFQLAEGGGMHYQPWATGIPQGGGGMGGGAGGFAGPDTWATGGGSNFVARPDPVFVAGGGTATGGPGPINPNIWGGTDTTGGGNVTTDTSGKQWVMSPGGQWYPADSDYGEGLLGTGRLFYDQHYDPSGAYMGSEGDQRRSIMSTPELGTGGAYSMVYVDDPKTPVPGSHFGTPWQDTIFAPAIDKWGINRADQRSDADKAEAAQENAERNELSGPPGTTGNPL